MKTATPQAQGKNTPKTAGPLDTSDVRSGSHVLVAMTVEQAEAAVAALDLFNRISLGQIQEIAMLVRMGEVPMSAERSQPRKIADLDTCDRIEDLLQKIKNLLGFSRGASNGVGHPHNTVKSMRTYELQKALSQAISTRPGSTTPECSVARDGIGPRYTTDAAPRATWVQVE